MTWELCDGSSQYLVDMWGGQPDNQSWQTAKKHFKEKGYFGLWLLIQKSTNGNFKCYDINIKQKFEKSKESEGDYEE